MQPKDTQLLVLFRRKKNELVVHCIFQIWVAYFGASGKFQSDCGREFGGETHG